MRRWLVAGNWKMNTTTADAIALATSIRDQSPKTEEGEIVLAPPFTFLSHVGKVLEGSHLGLAAQNMHYEEKGAYTGEISAVMLKDIGCTFVIIGHSERRKYFHETDETVNLKIKKALECGLKPIICVGETEEEREKGITEFVVGIQTKKALADIESLDDITIAYEPVWAIGTGKNATSMEAEEVHHFIRSVLGDKYGDASEDVRILYGGSVTAGNIGELIKMNNIDGALIGGAALKSENFIGIIECVMENR